jgi:glycine hydroxymethyltransferase
MGLEAIEQIEIRAEPACEVFGAKYAEIRVASGAIPQCLRLHGRRPRPATASSRRPRDRRPCDPSRAGAAGLYGIETHPAPIAGGYTVDVAALSPMRCASGRS